MTTTPYQLRALGDSAVRNLIINGNMDFWQRGTGPTTPSGSYTYLADRFSSFQSGYTMTQQRSTDVPTQVQSGFLSNYSLLMTNGTGASPTSGQYEVISYKVEGFDYQNIHAKKTRLQFWVKSSVTGTYALGLRNTGSTRGYVTTYSISNANTWTKILLDIPLDTTGTWAIDNTLGLEIMWALTSGSGFQTSTLNSWQTTGGTVWGANTMTQWGATTSATFQLAQVALYPGNFDSGLSIPFQRVGRSIGHELQMCQRYYEKSYDVGVAVPTNSQANGVQMLFTTTSLPNSTEYGSVNFAVPKRAAPTVTTYSFTSSTTSVVSNASNGADLTANSGHVEEIGTGRFNMQNTSGGTLTPGDGSVIFHWAADAEL